MTTQQQPRTFKANSLRSRFFALCGFAMLVACLAAWGSVSGQQAYATEDTQAEAVSVGTDKGTQTDAGMTYKVQAKSEAKVEKSADASAELPVVTVDAPEGALPEGAELHAELVESEKDNQAVADELEKADVTYDGFLALDVFFVDADGNEVEPTQPVDVRFELPKGAVPEGAEDLAVHHLAEAEDGTVDDVEAVADDADATEGTVEVQDDATVDAEFTVESFSTFTITWRSNYGYSRYFEITVHYVDESGKEIDDVAASNLSFEDGSSISFDTYAKAIDGKSYSGAHYKSYNGDEITRMVASETGYSSKTRKVTFYNEKTEVDDLTYNRSPVKAGVYLVYTTDEQQQQGDFYIDDTVAKDGRFTAKFADGTEPPLSDGQYIQYTWTRGLSKNSIGDDVAYTKVTGSSYNMAAENGTEDAVWVNVALDSDVADASEDQRYWYQVTAQVMNSDGTPVDGETYTATLQVPYYIQLQNGSFENPNNEDHTKDPANDHQYQYSNGTPGLIWRTTGEGTGTHEGADIEILRASTSQQKSNAQTFHNCGAADDGVQFAELNCEAYGALYQEVMTVPGSTLNWAFSHLPREVQKSMFGRKGDTMALVIMPSSAADEYIERLGQNSKNPNGIEEILKEIEGKGEENGYFVQRETSNYQYKENGTSAGEHAANSWNRYQGTYTVGDDQYLTTFFFVAVDTGSTESNAETIGNLLDRVYFTQDLIPADPDEANLTVTKHVEGLDLEANADYKVKIAVSDGDDELATHTFNANDFDASGDASYNVVVHNITAGGSKKVHVEETVSGVPGSYTSNSSVQVDGGSAKDATETDITVKGGNDHTVAFTNSYTVPEPPKPVKPDLHKYVAKNDDGSYDLSLDVHGTVRSDQADPTKVDIVYVLDLSYSMMWDMDGTYPGGSGNTSGDDERDDYSFARYTAATDAINALNDKLGQTGIDARAALVTFARDTKYTKGFSSLDAFALPDAAWSSFETGTNYEAGLTDALPIFNNARSDAQKVVVFISDGEPNRCLDSQGDEQNQNAAEATRQAAEVAGRFDADKFYVVGVGDEQFESYLQQVTDGARSSDEREMFKSSNREELISRFEGIAAEITSVNCTGVTITDTLSDYADLTDDAEFTVSITTGYHGGEPVTVTAVNGPVRVDDNGNVENAKFTFTDGSGTQQKLTLGYDGSTKTFTLTFPEDYALEDGWTYTVTTQIEPSDTAVGYFNEHGTYPDKGGSITDVPGTAEENYISTGKDGFHTNKKANLTYESAGAQQIDEYPTPVITFDSKEIGYAVGVEKVLEGADLEENMFEFSIEARQTGKEDDGTFVSADDATKVAGLTSNPYKFSNGTTTSGAIDGLRGMSFTTADARAERVFEYLITETGMSDSYQGDYSKDDFVFDETQYLLQFKPVIVHGLLEVQLYQATIEDGNVSSANPVLIGTYPSNGPFEPADASLTQAEGGAESREIGPEYKLTFTNEFKDYGLTIYKYGWKDLNNNGKVDEGETAAPRPGAKFTVTPVSPDDGASLGPKETANDGNAVFEDGLKEDVVYAISETWVPSGYDLAEDRYFMIKDGTAYMMERGNEGVWQKIYVDDEPSTIPTISGNPYMFRIEIGNKETPDLPQSGSSGTLIMSSVGVATIILAGVYLLNRRFPLSK